MQGEYYTLFFNPHCTAVKAYNQNPTRTFFLIEHVEALIQQWYAKAIARQNTFAHKYVTDEI